jgi:hypothetical protein
MWEDYNTHSGDGPEWGFDWKKTNRNEWQTAESGLAIKGSAEADEADWEGGRMGRRADNGFCERIAGIGGKEPGEERRVKEPPTNGIFRNSSEHFVRFTKRIVNRMIVLVNYTIELG